MKFKFIFTTLLSLIHFASCPGKGSSSFLLPITRPGEFRLVYEPGILAESEIPESVRKEWQNPTVKLRSNDASACLFAGAELAFGLSVCFPDPKGEIDLEIQNILTFWNENPEGRTESEEWSFSELGTGKLKVELIRDLLSDCDEDWLILSGDPSLDKTLKKVSFPNTNLVSVFSEDSSIRPHSPNAFVGFSIFASSQRMKIVFHPKNRIRALNSLVLEIPGNVSILSDFISEIRRKNSEVVSRCKDGIPELSEVFGGVGSSTGRFLEFRNSTLETICFQDLNLELNAKPYSIQKGKEFLLPGETILRIESGSLLPGNEISGFPWVELKKKGEWFLKTRTKQVSVFNRESDFQVGERFYSSFGNQYSLCKKEGLFEISDRLCMSPGFDVKGNDLEDSSFCRIEEFQLEEVNFTGLFLKDKIDQNHKFIDLEYSGKGNCNPNALSVFLGETEYPIWLDSGLLKPNEILTLGTRDWMGKPIRLSLADLSDSKFGGNILLKDRFVPREILLSRETKEIPILKKENGQLLSLLFRNGRWIPHPIESSETLISSIRDLHAMNPGSKSNWDSSVENRKGELSEISWMGSYDGSTPISGDRFVELDSILPTSGILEIHSGTKEYRFLIPLEAGKTVFSSSRLVCFPNMKPWILPELSLGSSGEMRILSLDGNSVLDTFVWTSQGPGLNSTSQKARRSASKFRTLGGSVVWKNSAFSDSEERKENCSQTEASPSLANRTLPFLWKESSSSDDFFNPLLSWNLPNSAGIRTSEIQVLTFQPNFSQSRFTTEFYNLWIELRYSIFESWNIPKGSLVYLIPSGGDGLIQIPGDPSILISAIYPSPVLSTNEWVLICNRGKDSVDVRSLEIRDSSASDRLVEYSFRFGTSHPIGWETGNPDPNGWIFNDRFLNPGECGYILSPNFKNESVPFLGESYRKIFTIEKTTTIGNGIGKNEGLDLFQYVQQAPVHLHSYGNQYSPFPFALDTELGDLILLRTNRSGDSLSDYEIKKKDLP
ncbi:LIC11755 family lipoprotein [Leptospira stimsonii]|uniref:Lamin tail domain-containing protein n=1 Tax=Leptospira stimsonii TaxID=2202203 RepID=A0A396Z9Q3_9LEPT|nr:hypothetical protein [Leptospira stimsonii]RHX90534.1 hypothetical protein DLM75_08955 [Leptospira stimsonii]